MGGVFMEELLLLDVVGTSMGQLCFITLSTVIVPASTINLD